jgi:hypothetical protein
MEKTPSPFRDQMGQYVSYAAQQREKARYRLLNLRALAPTVYGDSGAFAALGIARHQKAIRNAELDVGLWEGRAG